MSLSPTRKGELLCGTHVILASLFPVVTVATLTAVPPIFSAGVSTFASALFFVLVLTFRKGWHEMRNRRAWKDILITSILIGVVCHGLIYMGLRTSGAGNGSLLAQMEVFFSFLILGLLLRHEALSLPHIAGASLIVMGVVFVLAPKASEWIGGEWLIVLATAVAPIGNIYAQRALRSVSAATILFVRSVISAIFFLFLSSVFERSPASVDPGIWWLMILNGCVLLGFSKILWIESLRYLPITKDISLSSVQPLLTLLWASIILGEQVTVWQIAGFVPMTIGVLLLTRK